MTCQIPGCDRAATRTASTICEMHYYRMRRTGTYDLRPTDERQAANRVPPIPCSVNGCERPACRWSNDQRVCRLHGQRWDRYGRFERIRETQPPRASRSVCTVTGCDKIDDGPHGLCKMHKTRLDRHGDVTVAIPQSQRAFPRGADHPKWTGANATYVALHQRVRNARGSASKQRCIGCGKQAAQWSYDHRDEHERVDEHGPYSLDLGHYVPRCVSCHKRFDLGYLRTSA